MDPFTALERAAIAFDQAKRRAIEIREARNPIECERQNNVGFANERPGSQDVPCWKLWKEDRFGEGFDRDDIVNWCPSCQRRQALSDDLRKANATRGARMRHFHKLAWKAFQEAEQG